MPEYDQFIAGFWHMLLTVSIHVWAAVIIYQNQQKLFIQ